MSKGERKHKLPPEQTVTPPNPQRNVVGLPSTINFNEQHLHISGDLANTLQVVNQMAPDMRVQAMEMARKEQQHRHEKEREISEQNFSLKKMELEASETLQSRQLLYIFITDLFAKIITFIFVGAFLATLIYMAVIGNYQALLALTGLAVLMGVCIRFFAWVMNQNSSAK